MKLKELLGIIPDSPYSGNYIEVFSKKFDEQIFAGNMNALTASKVFKIIKDIDVFSQEYTVIDITHAGGYVDNKRAKTWSPTVGHTLTLNKVPKTFTQLHNKDGKMANIRVVTSDVHEEFVTRQVPVLRITVGDLKRPVLICEYGAAECKL